MFDPSILLFAPSMDNKVTIRSLDLLLPISLPNTKKYFATNGMIDSERSTEERDLEALYPAAMPLYPAALPFLRTFGIWAERSGPSDVRFRDGYDLYCLRTILIDKEDFDYAVLLRGVEDFDEQWPELQRRVGEQTFHTFAAERSPSIATFAAEPSPSTATFAAEPSPSITTAERNVVFNLNNNNARGLLERASDLYFSGAAYAMAEYTLRDALATALHSMSIEEKISQLANGSA